jgi:integrin beta 3
MNKPASQLEIDHTADVLWSVMKTYLAAFNAAQALEIKQLREEAATRDLQVKELRELVELAISEKPIAGKDGAPGINGKDGADGLHGKDGADGINGKDGADGLPGKNGIDGVNGKDGIHGTDGKDGAPGKDALPVDMDAVRALVSSWLENNPPKNGEPGRDGLDGKDGLPGRAGEIGLTGADGRPGEPGRDGRDGLPGINGKDGAPGLPGKDGKDGLSYKTTVPFEDERSFGYDAVFEDGSTVEHRWTKGTMADTHHGIWKEGHYPKGAAVTYAGSCFLAFKDTDGKPEISPDWKLIVKRGRDGKDGKPGTPGARGEKGDRGEQGNRGFNGL